MTPDGLTSLVAVTSSEVTDTPPPDPASPSGRASRRLRTAPAAPWQERVAHVYGYVLHAITIWLLIAILIWPFNRELVREIGDILSVTNIPTRSGFFSLVLVAFVTSGFLRRQRAAMLFVVLLWQLPSLLMYIVLIVLLFIDPTFRGDLFSDFNQTAYFFLSTLIAAASVVLLIASRKAFPARIARGAWLRALAVLCIGVLSAIALGMAVLEVSHGTLHSQRDRFNWTVSIALGLAPKEEPFATQGQGIVWLGVLISFISTAGLLAAISVFLRAAPHDPQRNQSDLLAVRRLLLTSECSDSLSYFATRDDRETVFSPDGRAAVSFRIVAGVCLAAGDPIGHRDSWAGAIDAWLSHARQYGWVPGVLSASEQGAQAYQRIGLRPLSLGDEAIVHTRTFSLNGPAMRAVRHAVARPKAAGYSVIIRRQSEIPAQELTHLADLAAQWRQGNDRGYTMALNRLADPRDPQMIFVTTHDHLDQVQALLTFVPWGRQGLSLDTMRRSPNAVSGVTEFMVTELAERARSFGIETISLNFAVLREKFAQGARVGASRTQRMTRQILLFASRWWQLDSLYRANEKYAPQWHPRFMCYEKSSQLSQLMIAAGQAEGFLPALPRFFQRRTLADDPLSAAELETLARSIIDQEQEILEKRLDSARRCLTDQQRARHAKLDILRAAGMEPYPVGVPRTAALSAIRESPSGTMLSVTGRVVRLRDFGGVQFAVLRDGLTEAQVMFTADRMESNPMLWRRGVDLADQVSVTGQVTVSRLGEPTLHASSWKMASKALTTPPDKRHGFADPEARVRNRHIELALDSRAARTLRGRSVAIRALREELAARGYLEVETPVLQAVHGGANARPFVTHINAYDTSLYLRIAPELFLKRLVIGGMDKVFEVARNFRNEGVDATHNPEFTALEAYQTWADYTTMRELTRELIIAAAIAVHGEPVAHRSDGRVVRLDGPWPVVTVHDAVSAALGAKITPDTSVAELTMHAGHAGVHIPHTMSAGEIVAELYDELVEGRTEEPTFYTDFPVETSPLTRVHRDDPRLAERWDLVAFGAELGTAYSELVDPIDQRDRLTAQSLKAAAGDVEAMEVDEDFLSALEFGMPPTGGLGIGVDRVYMMLIGASIRETLAFPFVRPTRKR